MIYSNNQSETDRQKRVELRRRRMWSTPAPATTVATPIMQWTIHAQDAAGKSRADILTPRGGSGDGFATASSRKLAALLWRLIASSNGSGSVTWRYDLFDRVFEIPECGTEEDTKWDYYYCCCCCCYSNGLFGVNDARSRSRPEALLKTKEPIDEIKSAGGLRKRINDCFKSFKRSERSSMRLIVKNLVSDIKRERRKSRKLDAVNFELQSDISGARLSAKKFLRYIEKEKKWRGLLEKDCQELEKYINCNRAEIRALRDQRARVQEEIERERQMLQMAEVWREERVQMKLADAKSILENKLAKINNLIVDCEVLMQPSAHGASNVHHTNPHAVSDSTRKIARKICSEDTRSGKEMLTQADVSSCQTPGSCGEDTVNTTQSSKNMFICDENCRKKAFGGSQSLQSDDVSSVTFMNSTKKGSTSFYEKSNQKHSNNSICSTKYQLSPGEH